MMPIHFCPHCNQRFTVGFDTTDFIHECNSGNPVLDQEDVLIVGDWEDFSGSGTAPAQQVMRQGITNELQGTKAGVLGADKDAETRRGATAETHRQRQHLEFISMKNNNY